MNESSLKVCVDVHVLEQALERDNVINISIANP